MKAITIVLILLSSLLSFAQSEPAPPISPDQKQALINAVGLLVDFLNMQDQRLNVAANNFQLTNENYKKIQENLQQVTNTANAAQAKADQAANALADVSNSQTQLRDQLTQQINLIKADIDKLKQSTSTAPDPVPTKFKLAWSATSASSGYADLSGATVPVNKRVYIGVVQPSLSPFTTAAATTAGIKTVVFMIDSLSQLVEYNAPYDMSTGGQLGILFQVVGTHNAKVIVNYANGTSENYVATFQVK